MKKIACLSSLTIIMFALSSCGGGGGGQTNSNIKPTPSSSPTSSTAPIPVVEQNMIDSDHKWDGTKANQACGQRTEHYLHPVCDFLIDNPSQDSKPPAGALTACIDMAKRYASTQADKVCGDQTCKEPGKCKINHVIMGQPNVRFEDIPSGYCPNQTAGWSCRIDITYDCLCH